ncbi:MAG TPA: 4Fe-4S dicluster domain-containing protein [Planctomycetes bacterium]|nr:4Fe-4S dicluster domain-containing protein [Fuerstiella sp.]HIK95430.1 4Fe-4S dicluster domain-containing protein [Planctomycetota bacterium]
MRQRAISIAIALLSGAIVAAVLTHHPLARLLFGGSSAVGLTIGCVLFAAAVIAILTSFDRGRTNAAVRLDWFVPHLRRLHQGQEASPSLTGRLLRRIIPASLQSDRVTKKRGIVRRLLRRLGVSWLASPVRRIVQAVCLITFLILFFYVCWPYSAAPQSPGHASSGWTFRDIDQDSGEFLFTGTVADDWIIAANQTLFVFNESASESKNGAVGAFRVSHVSDSSIRLQPEGELTPELFDVFFTSTASWALHETDPTAWPSHYADDLTDKEFIPAETFLIIDPLVSLSTAVAARSWVWSLVSAAIILIVCVLIPRGFCGYLCPLGTTIDLFDWAIAGRVKRFRAPDEGWWVHIKYYLLAGTMVCAVFGVLVSGFFSAIPVITRGMLFLFEPLQVGALRGWHLIPSMNAGHFVSLIMFAGVLGLGFLRPRFWCKYVCPSGAIFSLGNLFRATERKVESTCINCNKCVEICPFDAIKPDFTTRTTDCTMCQSCGGVCPTHAIKFVERWNFVELKAKNDPRTKETSIGRRGFLSLASGSAAAVVGAVGLTGVTKAFGANLENPNAFRPVRPPGSVPEQEFLEMCIRCGECFKACPNNVLQPEGFQQGLEGLWTPVVVADWAGCDSSCNACGEVCPTGAIRALPLAEKKMARMGLAIVSETTCLPFAGREACDLCVQECNAAGYRAIEYTQVGTEVDDNGEPIDGTGYLAPVVLQDKCVGCGLCQTRCNVINVKEKGLLSQSAIIIEAGDGKEDRLTSGSYIELRKTENQRAAAFPRENSGSDYFVPDSAASTGPLGTSHENDQ